MFRKLRLQFITIASVAITMILISFVGLFNTVRYVQNNSHMNTLLTILSENNGEFPSLHTIQTNYHLPNITATSLNDYRYYSALVNNQKELLSINLTHDNLLSQEEMEGHLKKIDLAKKTGIFRASDLFYVYKVNKVDGTDNYFLVVIDATRFTSDRSDMVGLSLQLSLMSLIFFVLVISIFSNFAIKPFVENYEKQKRFITNASHELKTPLAIISANTEMQELLYGETEWTKSSKDQTARLTDLINQLVILARLEEQAEFSLSDCDFSAIASDAAEDFKGLILKDGKSFTMEIKPNIHVHAEPKSLFELVTILVDNANKYCDPGGQVLVKLSQTSLRKAKLEVTNDYAAGKGVDYSRFFDRFYREDESHNSQKQGYGIGLSMAESMVRLFKGKISASYKNEKITFTVIL